MSPGPTPSRWRHLLATALPALAAGALLAGLGVLDVVHAALLVVAGGAVVHVWRTLETAEPPSWPDLPADRRDGARNDLSELGWATFTRDGTVGDRMRRRVRALAADRLAERGIDLVSADASPADRTAAVQLLGADVVDGLVSRRPPTRAEVYRWLDAIESLHPTTDGRHTA